MNLRTSPSVLKHEPLVVGIDENRLVAKHLLSKNPLGEVIEDIVLNGTFHRASTELRVVAYISKPLDSRRYG